MQEPSHQRPNARKAVAILLGLMTLMSVTVVGISQDDASAQSSGDTTMLLFDLSGSMNAIEPDGQTRLATAKSAMVAAIGGLAPGSLNVGIRSFSDCGMSTLEQAPAPVDAASLAATINSFTASGSTDISNALSSVANDFGNTTGRQSVILLSDGLDNCGGDPCATAQNLIANGIDIIVNAIGIGTAGTAAEAQLGCIATVTGGTVVSVDSADELFDAIDVAITGGATSAIVGRATTVCVNSAYVQSNPAFQTLSVGDTYTDTVGNEQLIVSGEACGYDCVDGFDMNCDGVLGDFCDSAFGRNTVAGAGECSATTISNPDETVNPTCTVSLIECYAPEVRFHEFETFFPMDPLDFIAGSTLTWVHSANGALRRCWRDEPLVVSPDPFLLGQGEYVAQQEEPDPSWTNPRRCSNFGPEYTTTEYTRPYSDRPSNITAGDRALNGDGQILEVQEGFVLEWNDWVGNRVRGLDNNPGFRGAVNAPMFAQIFQSPEYGKAIIYHMFYGFDPKSRLFGDGEFAHEGDWERIIVVLGPDDTPTEVRFEGHGCSGAHFASINYIPWDKMSREAEPPTTPGTGHLVDGTHPVVYVAEGSHASYPYLRPAGDKACTALEIAGVDINSGEKDDTVFNDRSSTWRPFDTGQVLDAQSQCWYGFGGAWGDTGDTLTLIGRADDTGPAGPHWNIDGLAPGTLCGPQQTTTISSGNDSLGFGETVIATLAGYTPGMQIIATLASVEIAVAVTVIGADGTGEIGFTVPDGFEPGGHHLIFRDVATGEIQAINQVNVIAPPECLIAGDGTSIANDVDGDNLLDSCDKFLTTGPAADFDGDGINNFNDNCPRVVNPDQAGLSRSPVGFACEIGRGYNPAAHVFLELTSDAIPGPATGNSIPVRSTPQLAHTGSESALLAGLGMNLMAMGLTALGVARLRRRRPTSGF